MDGTTISPNQPKQDTQKASESVSLSLPSAANTELKKTQMIPHSDSVATSCVEESQTAETKMEQSFPVQPEPPSIRAVAVLSSDGNYREVCFGQAGDGS